MNNISFTWREAQIPTEACRNMNGVRVLRNLILVLLSDFFCVGSSRLVNSS